MRNPPKVYTANDAKCLDLLKYGRDHINASTCLFKTMDLRLYDSAGFLAHLGIELFLKAVLLNSIKEFPETHKLIYLAKKINEVNAIITPEILQEMAWLDSLWFLKYPNLKAPAEIGTDDVPRFNIIVRFIESIIPTNLLKELRDSPATEKGGRIWMEMPESSINGNQ